MRVYSGVYGSWYVAWHVGLGFRLTLGLAAEVEDLCNPAREHGQVRMAVTQERFMPMLRTHAYSILARRVACCALELRVRLF